MAKKNIPFKNTIGAEGGIDLEENNLSKGKITWNKNGEPEHVLKAEEGDDTLIYEKNGVEEKIIHTGNLPHYFSEDKHREYEMPLSKTWSKIHDLGKKVSISTQDSAGTQIRGSIKKNDGIEVIVEFNVPISGLLILN